MKKTMERTKDDCVWHDKKGGHALRAETLGKASLRPLRACPAGNCPGPAAWTDFRYHYLCTSTLLNLHLQDGISEKKAERKHQLEANREVRSPR